MRFAHCVLRFSCVPIVSQTGRPDHIQVKRLDVDSFGNAGLILSERNAWGRNKMNYWGERLLLLQPGRDGVQTQTHNDITPTRDDIIYRSARHLV
jgi:hypothetical protein